MGEIMSAALLTVRNLAVLYPARGNQAAFRAVDGISFEIQSGQIFGLAGESGSGKSSAARAILQLIRPITGEVLLEGVDLCKLSEGALRPLRKQIQIVFQDPLNSLNPRMRVRQIIEEPLLIHRIVEKNERKHRVVELANQVGLGENLLERFPHELSGGQRQRVGIARALATQPKLFVCDEPVSALDVSIRAQIVNLLKDLQQQLGLSYLFISHDLSLMRYLCDEIAVMQSGRIVERAPTEELFSKPAHAYTQKLIESIPHF